MHARFVGVGILLAALAACAACEKPQTRRSTGSGQERTLPATATPVPAQPGTDAASEAGPAGALDASAEHVPSTSADTDPSPSAQPTRFDLPLTIDLRHPKDFAAGHAAGAVNIQWGWDQLGARIAAYVPDKATAFALVGSAEELESARRVLADMGYTRVSGRPNAARDVTLSTWTAAELRERLASDAPPVVIDVRATEEWRTGTIEGALLVDQDAAPELVSKLDPERQYAIICEGGFRSSQLASLLVRAGFHDVHNVIDGMYAWRNE